jgi:antitoxin YefM
MLVIIGAMTIVPLAEAKAHLSELVTRTGTHERIEITVYGRPAAVLISADDLAALEETIGILSDHDALADFIKGSSEVASGDVHDLDEVVEAFNTRRTAR